MHSYKWLLALWGATLFLLNLASGYGAIVVLGLYTFIYYVLKITFMSRLQKVVPDATRATTTSVSGFFEELFAIISFAIVGFWASSHSYQSSIMLIGGIIIIAAGAFWLASRLLHQTAIEKTGI